MGSDHYFTATPASPEHLRRITVTLAERQWQLTTAGGVFSPEHLDTGTAVLLANTPPPPATGNILDLGCGWGPISIDLAARAPQATIWAVDVNERALDLVRRNATEHGLDNIRAVRPEEVPPEVQFRSIRSNPPIRVGKNVLHGMLHEWFPRIEPGGDAWLVVARNLGSDSLQKWLATTMTTFTVQRAATSRGFRVLLAKQHPVDEDPSSD